MVKANVIFIDSDAAYLHVPAVTAKNATDLSHPLIYLDEKKAKFQGQKSLPGP